MKKNSEAAHQVSWSVQRDLLEQDLKEARKRRNVRAAMRNIKYQKTYSDGWWNMVTSFVEIGKNMNLEIPARENIDIGTLWESPRESDYSTATFVEEGKLSLGLSLIIEYKSSQHNVSVAAQPTRRDLLERFFEESLGLLLARAFFFKENLQITQLEQLVAYCAKMLENMIHSKIATINLEKRQEALVPLYLFYLSYHMAAVGEEQVMESLASYHILSLLVAHLVGNYDKNTRNSNETIARTLNNIINSELYKEYEYELLANEESSETDKTARTKRAFVNLPGACLNELFTRHGSGPNPKEIKELLSKIRTYERHLRRSSSK